MYFYKKERMKTNQNVAFKLTDDEIKEIKNMDTKKSLIFEHTTPEVLE